MSNYGSENILGVLKFVKQIISKFNLNSLIITLFQESLQSLSEITSYMARLNFSKSSKTIVRDLEVSIDKTLRYVVKTANRSKVGRLMKLESERYKLSTLLRNILNRLTTTDVFRANEAINKLQKHIDNIEAIKGKVQELDNAFHEIDSNLEKVVKEIGSNLDLNKENHFVKFINIINSAFTDVNESTEFDLTRSLPLIISYLKLVKLRVSGVIPDDFLSELPKVSYNQVLDFCEEFLKNTEKKRRLLENKIIAYLESNIYQNQLFFLCLSSNENFECHQKGDFLPIQVNLNRFNLKNFYVSRRRPVANIINHDIGCSIEPLIEDHFICFYTDSIQLLKQGSYFEVVLRGDNTESFEYFISRIFIHKILGNDNRYTIPINVTEDKLFYLEIQVRVGEQLKEIKYPKENDEVLQEIIGFYNGQVFLDPNKSLLRNKRFNVYYYFEPFKQHYLDSATVVRVGRTDYQVVYK